LLGTPDAESTQTLAQTVVAGDPSYAGPLAGVPLGLPVFHVFEPEVRDQIPGDVYEAQVALMEMSLDRYAILAGLREARRAASTTVRSNRSGLPFQSPRSSCPGPCSTRPSRCTTHTSSTTRPTAAGWPSRAMTASPTTGISFTSPSSSA